MLVLPLLCHRLWGERHMPRLSGASLPPPWFWQLHEEPRCLPLPDAPGCVQYTQPLHTWQLLTWCRGATSTQDRGESTQDPTELSQHHKVPFSVIFDEDLHFQEGIFLWDCAYDGGDLYFDLAAIRAIIFAEFHLSKGFPHGSVVKNLPANAGDLGSIPRLGRSPRGGHGTPLQYSCLENPMDREARWATVHAIANSRTWLSDKEEHIARYTSL